MSGASLVPRVRTENERAALPGAGGTGGKERIRLRVPVASGKAARCHSPDPAPGRAHPCPAAAPGLPALLVLDDSVNGEARWDEGV